MLFLAQKIRRKFGGSPTIVVVTDRDELNKQISDTFENCGLLGAAPAKSFIATSGSDLADKLRGNPSFIFTLIHKFNQPEHPPIEPGHDIIIMSDEAHRTQNGIFAENMMALLPTACRIGFTGTPLFSNDNITERTFGGYVSIYDFNRAVEDGATVPLYYENRADRLKEIKTRRLTTGFWRPSTGRIWTHLSRRSWSGSFQRKSTCSRRRIGSGPLQRTLPGITPTCGPAERPCLCA